MTHTKVSLCLSIAKEYQNAESILKKIHPFFNEIILINLGSLAEVQLLGYKFNAKVLSFSGNLVDAINLALKEASSEWVMVLKETEQLEIDSFDDFKSLLKEDMDCYYLLQDEISTPYKLKHSSSLRLFNKKSRPLFKSFIHRELVSFNKPFKAKLATGLILTSKSKQEEIPGLIESQGDDPHHLFLCANINYLSRHYHLALKLIHQLLNLTTTQSPLGSQILRLLIELLLGQEEYEKALLAIEKSLRIYPKFTDLLFFKGLCLYQKGRFSEAINVFHECIEKDDVPLELHPYQGLTEHMPLYYLGKAYEKLGEKGQAIVAYTKSLQACPRFSEAIKPLIKNLMSCKTLAETINYLDTYFDFNSIRGVEQLAHSFFSLNELKVAYNYLLELEKKKKLFDSEIIMKARCLLILDKFQQAELLLKDIYPTSDFYIESLKLKCIIFWQNNDFVQARKIILNIDKETKDKTLSQLYSQVHNFLEKGFSFFEQQAQVNRKIKNEIFYLIHAFLQIKNKNLVIFLEDLLHKYTGLFYFYDLAEFYFNNSYLTESKAILKKLLDSQSYSSQVFFLLGQIQLKEKHPYLACHFFQQAITLEPEGHMFYLGLFEALNYKALEVINKGLSYYPDSELLQLKQEELLRMLGNSED